MADDPLAPAAPAPLAIFEGREPPAPDWFKWAIAQAPERTFVTVNGAKIELLAWGERGNPGLLLVHGNSANADWWSFIAPFLAKEYRVAAVTLSGMGGSDWRDAYNFEGFAQDMGQAAQAAGLYDAPIKPIFIGHSFGGSQVFYAARNHPDWMRAVVLVDSGLSGPPPEAEGFNQPQARTQPHRVYPTLAAALARFRLMPPQGCSNLYIADFIARKSLKPVPLADGGEGWTWRFDPLLWSKLDRTGMENLATQKVSMPIVHIHGDRSEIVYRDPPDPNHEVPPIGVTKIVVPDCEHHVMVDQPLALVTAIRALLVGWP